MQQTNMATENQPFQKEIHLQTWLLFGCHVRFQAGIYLRISDRQHPASKKKEAKDCVTEARTSIHPIYNLSVFSLFVLSIYKKSQRKTNHPTSILRIHSQQIWREIFSPTN